MVLRGQYLERPALIQADDLVLEGLYHRGDVPPGLLICPPVEPEGTGGMDAPAVSELAFSSARHRRASLRFAYRGIGASQGARDPARAVDDAAFALQHLLESVGTHLSLSGYLSGCKVAVELARRTERSFRHLVLVAPTDRLELSDLGTQIMVVLPEEGDETIADHYREVVEKVDGRLEIILEADQRFHRGLEDISRMAGDFIQGGGRSEKERSEFIERLSKKLL